MFDGSSPSIFTAKSPDALPNFLKMGLEAFLKSSIF